MPTHIDVLTEVIAEHANISLEKARSVMKKFRGKFPPPPYIDRELTEFEVKEMRGFYKQNRELLKWVSEIVKYECP